LALLSGFFIGLITLNDPAFDFQLVRRALRQSTKEEAIMGISRRQFLLSIPAAGAGFILPSYFDKAVDVLAQTGEPLIIPPEECLTELIAVDQGFGEFQLNVGDPWKEPPRMTLREFIGRYYESDVDSYVVENCDGEEELDLDAEVDPLRVMETWALTDSPNALAFGLLYGLDLGADLHGPGAVGELQFIDGPCPGNDYIGVHATDALTLSLLQERLNQLNTGIHIRVA
jgi:hypothetical protein